MAKLMNLKEISYDELVDVLSNNEILVCEDVQGSKIYANYNGTEWIIKPKSIASEPINTIDLTMQRYYDKAFRYLNSIDDRAKKLLDKSWWFGFEYFPDEQPANIEYAKLPKNNLVLMTIYKKNKYKYTVDELKEYSRLLGVEEMPIIFKGKLNESALTGIKYFLNTSEQDLEYVFGEKSFAFFFYKLLNPLSVGSFLMGEEFHDNLEKLIIRVIGKNISFKVLNPSYQQISDANNTTEFTDMYSVILLNFLAFCQTFDLKDIKPKGTKKDEIYLYIICKMYNRYIENTKDDLLDFNIVVPEFFDKDKFKINVELITNKNTIKYIEEDPKLEYIFKCILGSFNKQKKNVIGIFNETTLKMFNKYVEDLMTYIDYYMGKQTEIELARKGLMNFSDFYKIKYDTDVLGDVYPDVHNAFEEPSKTSDKKKKGKDVTINKNEKGF